MNLLHSLCSIHMEMISHSSFKARYLPKSYGLTAFGKHNTCYRAWIDAKNTQAIRRFSYQSHMFCDAVITQK